MARGRKFPITPFPLTLDLLSKIKERGHNFKSISAKAGCGHSISRWARDTHPRIDTFCLVAEALGYDVKLVPRADIDNKPGT